MPLTSATTPFSELVQWGIRAEDAAKIGLHFVFSFAVPEGQPSRAPMFRHGKTLLLVTSQKPCEVDPAAPGCDGWAIVSDVATASLREEALKANGDDARPVLVLSLSNLVARIAAGLGENPDTFLRAGA